MALANYLQAPLWALYRPPQFATSDYYLTSLYTHYTYNEHRAQSNVTMKQLPFDLKNGIHASLRTLAVLY